MGTEVSLCAVLSFRARYSCICVLWQATQRALLRVQGMDKVVIDCQLMLYAIQQRILQLNTYWTDMQQSALRTQGK